jgi:23S rRNA (uracil1939-C5)-methyltransferase
VYVSCNLPTLTRDLRALSERGYEVEMVKVVDMFPQTHHVETISVVRARG